MIISGFRVSGQAEGKVCRVRVMSKDGTVHAEIATDGTVALNIESLVESAPTIPTILSMPALTNGKVLSDDDSPTKRTFKLDEMGEIEDTEIVFLTPVEFARATAGPSGPLEPVRTRKHPFGRCIEFYDEQCRLCRTVWSSRFAKPRAG